MTSPVRLSLLSLVALIPALVLGFGPSCNVYTGDLIGNEPAKVDASDASDASDAPETSEASATPFYYRTNEAGCVSATGPKAEDFPPDADGASIPVLWFGISSLRLGAYAESGEPNSGAWRDIGLDLDGLCTSTDSCPAADNPQNVGCMNPNAQADGKLCRDNNFAKNAASVQRVGGQYGLGEPGVNCGICNGQFNMLFRVSEYNGRANDSRVRVDVYPSQGLEQNIFEVQAKACQPDEWNPTGLCWRQTDRWKLRTEVLATGGPVSNTTPSRIFDAKAYVRDGTLVAHLPDGSLFWFPHKYGANIATFPLVGHKTVVLGKIHETTAQQWEISDGMIAGRMPKASISDAFEKLGICPGNGLYPLMASFVDSSLDSLLDGTNDSSKACDAMTFGIGFSARLASPGSPASQPALSGCPDAGIDARSDAKGL